ncbi:helix-turn-helix domain-containing protein [Clostridioides difficile]|uniref:helix-turn-helix domain-containing protein n=1 Tax=Clostridioides difficile TaxID=1496 RepID=UPI000C99F43E|nr:helix-turn-helix transcriptional regulator [Clostridioides difficile]MDB3424656.1 helix-turn-helix domain-containing protein [Clostridioides difficile]MDB3475613.1 helix-turn-helix domain-containing protein [Clostridioides difficile]UUV14826.1 helix-turn-helix domain-containing protein [Clostridioides difficile]HCQ6056238.1 helix-turn-helix transcriptional regulator [Clostridioides difficile]
MPIYKRIKELRKNVLKLTQEDFSKKINISRSNLGSLEIDRVKVTDRVISDICREFSVNENWLRYGKGDIFIENDDTIISELSNKYSLDSLDVKILESYLKLSGEQRKAIKKYVYSLVDTILEDDELYQDYRGEYIEENAQQSAARNGNTENIEEAINLYDNLDDTLER